jgi:WD40 repeat protein
VTVQAGWPFLFSQAGRHGNRVLLVPGLPVATDFVGALHRAAGASTADGAGRGTFTTGDGAAYTVVCRRVRAVSDGTVQIFNLGTGRHVSTLDGHRGRVSSVAFAPDGLTIATAGWDGSLRLWAADSGAALVHRPDRALWLAGCRFDPAGARVAACGYDGTVVVFDARSGAEFAAVRLGVPLAGALAFNAPGRILLAAGLAGEVQLLHLATGTVLPPLAGHDAPVTSMAMTASGRLLATASQDGTVIVWDLRRRARVMRLRGHAGWVTGCAFATGGAALVTSGWDGTVRRWDLAGRSMTTAFAGEAPLTALSTTGSGTTGSGTTGSGPTGSGTTGSGTTADARAIVSDPLGRIVVVDVARATGRVAIDGLPGLVDVLACSPDGRLLAIGGLAAPRAGGTAAADGYGRPATFTEGVVLPGADIPYVPSDSEWDRVHVASLQAFAVASTDRSGRRILTSTPL